MGISDQSANSGARTNPRKSPRSVSVVEGLVSALGRGIASGVWKPDDSLPTEPEIAHRFGAGRNAVREAIKILAAKGFVRTERRAGTIVRPEFCWNLLDSEVLSWMLSALANRDNLLEELSELRAIIEPPVAALAATHASAMETLRIFEAYHQLEKRQNEMPKAFDADLLFHELIFEASHNRLLIATVPAFSLLLRTSFEISVRTGEPLSHYLKEHKQIADAISRRDPEAARRATRKLLARNTSDLSELIKRERRSRK
ncbi:MAG: FadR family transcriptional regulator [Verrucomicrobia bacterium]|nr:FadR family transcriptional regulator [Verrucomicrobiota bacterium]